MKKYLRRKKITTKHFGPYIDITDPCYDDDVWCRMNKVKIKEGEYACYVWRSIEKQTYEGKEYVDNRVGRIAIYLDGEIPHISQLKVIGEIGVDAGLAGFFTNKPNYSPSEWFKFCDNLGNKKDVWTITEGFFSSSGYGDGCYPVLAAKNEKGEITALEIVFI